MTPQLVLSIGGLIVAVISLVLSLLTGATQLRDRRRIQASRVVAWIEPASDHDDGEHIATIVNRSEDAVRAVVVRPPTQPDADPLYWDLLPPGAEYRVRSSSHMAADPTLGPTALTIKFVDSLGRGWERTGRYGHLVRDRGHQRMVTTSARKQHTATGVDQ